MGFKYCCKDVLLLTSLWTFISVVSPGILDRRISSDNGRTKVFTINREFPSILNKGVYSEEEQTNKLTSENEFQPNTINSNVLTEEERLSKKSDQSYNAREIETNEINKDESGLCDLPDSLKNEIKGYQGIADTIIATVLNGSFRGRTYNELSYFVDRFGSRLFGTANLENAIDFMLDKMTQDGLENVHGENATIPRWIRGEESATLILPRKKKLSFLGLGLSVGTPPGGITAEVLVVRSFDELKMKAADAKGKIVVFNENFKSYGETVSYRSKGASEVAKVGGVASLIRSITPYSINSPHTGQQDYEANVTQIPTACITIEDAELLDRIQSRGQKIIIELKMNDYNLPLTTSRNVIGEIKGREKPDEIVVVSGHIDSWDVGQGAMDDGGGLMITVEALALLKFLKLTPKRTMRSILWTAEEPGLWGARDYVDKHKNEMDKFNAVFESDIGTFRPSGLDFSGTDKAGCIIQQVLKLLASVNATMYRKFPAVGSDINYFIDKGVPGLSLNNDNAKYFYYHHSEGDTMTVENSDELDLCTAVWAVSSYVLADLSIALPRS